MSNISLANRNGAGDALSRRGQSSEDEPEDSDEADNYFDTQLCHIYISGNQDDLTAHIYLQNGYEGKGLVLGRYLETLQRDRSAIAVIMEEIPKFLSVGWLPI